jgi:AcrR family transcriptional regulator
MTTAAEIRSAARQQLRDALLDATHALVVELGWHRVRMGTVASAVGVSRQTLHSEFGTKEALGQALVMRETDRFLLGVRAALESHAGALGPAVRTAVEYALRRAAEDPLIRAILTGSSEDTLLPLLTSRPTLEAASAAMRGWIGAHFPELADDRVHEVVDSLTRLVLSHAVVPVDPPDVVGDRLARLVETALER